MFGKPGKREPQSGRALNWHITTLVYVVHDDRLLLMYRKKQPNRGLWSPPGGKLEPGESPIAGAMRELHEETGLTGTRPRLAAVVSELDETRRDAWLMFAVRADTPTSAIASDGREGECRWINLDKLASIETPPADLHILRAVLDESPGVSFLQVRLDDGVLVSIASHRHG